MIRVCNGQDPNLQADSVSGLPCACGLSFDDVLCEVIYPHRALPPQLTDEQLDALVVKYLGVSVDDLLAGRLVETGGVAENA